MRFIGTAEICPLPAFVRKPAGGCHTQPFLRRSALYSETNAHPPFFHFPKEITGCLLYLLQPYMRASKKFPFSVGL